MALEKKDLFSNEIDPEKYFETNKLYEIVGERKEEYKIDQRTRTIIKNYEQPFDPEYDDLSRLHYLSVKRKALTILEFGVGKSTLIFANALNKNEKNIKEQDLKKIRRENLFHLFSVDASKKWITHTKKQLKEAGYVNKTEISHSKTRMSEFNGKICTKYDKIPNCMPDIIYLDAPDQYIPIGRKNGITTAHPDRMPMSADILLIEYYLQPGCLIIIDGRGANAQLIKNNLQRNWAYLYVKEYDQHFLELQENELGIYNKAYLEYSLGKEYYERIKIK